MSTSPAPPRPGPSPVVLARADWLARAAAHRARVDEFIEPHLARRETRIKHPVHDFMFVYYSLRPAQLRRWHPGYDVILAEAPDYLDLRGYRAVPAGVGVDPAHLVRQLPLIQRIERLLRATLARPAQFGCFGLHEWAMVHRSEQHGTRHDWPLRLGQQGTDEIVESNRIICTHYDAFRFFTPSARSLNTLQPNSNDREAFEQPGCLHAGMDLYKHAYRLIPLINSNLIADCFDLAREIRETDMRASPYDLSDLGFDPIPIETNAGKASYAAAQRDFAARGQELRTRLRSECANLIALGTMESSE